MLFRNIHANLDERTELFAPTPRLQEGLPHGKPPKGHSLSAADVVLLPRKRAMITYVDERLRRAKLIDTRVVARTSRSDGTRYGKAHAVTNVSSRLRMAPNIAATGSRVAIVLQSGPLDGSRRNLYATRLR